MASTTMARPESTRRSALRPPRPKSKVGLLYTLPFFVFFALFLIWPTVYGLWMSLTNRNLASGSGADFLGLANYAEAFADPMVWHTLLNTLWFTVLTTIPLVVFSLVAALLVNLGLPGQWVWRLSFFLPFVLASTVVSLYWKWLYNPDLGLFNTVLSWVGIDGVSWLQDEKTAMFAIAITTTWWTLGFNFLLYLAALQNIPAPLYEAAAIDGAGRWRQLFSITLPLVVRTTVLILILQVLASLKVFDQIFQMTGGGPNDSTRSILMYVYDSGFTGYRLGFASAISYIFFAIILVFALLQLKFSRRSDS